MSSSNRGTGAGGSNTNKNGLPFERCVCPRVYTVGEGARVGASVLFLKQNDFIKHMCPVTTSSGRLFKPDGAYVTDDRQSVTILECKYQSVAGSADEKILNSPTKLSLYKRAYPNVKRWRYVLVLCEWFKQPMYAEWLDVLRDDHPEIDVWWAQRTTEVQVKLEVSKSGYVKVLFCNYSIA